MYHIIEYIESSQLKENIYKQKGREKNKIEDSKQVSKIRQSGPRSRQGWLRRLCWQLVGWAPGLLKGALFLGSNGGCRIILINHHHMRVYLLGQLRHTRTVLHHFITTIIGLFLDCGLYGPIIWQGYLICILERRGFGEIDSIHIGHPTF